MGNKRSARLILLVLTGLCLGAGAACMVNVNFNLHIPTIDTVRERFYLTNSGKAERDLAELYYTAYRNKRGQLGTSTPVLIEASDFRARLVLTLARISSQPHWPYMRVFASGMIFLKKGEYESASRRFDRVYEAKIPYLDVLALLYSSYCYEQSSDFYPALKRLLDLEKSGGNRYPEVFFNIARIYDKIGQSKKADDYRQRYEIIQKRIRMGSEQ
jgi:tetratricopeptide (TPR) repeat protein